MIDRLADTYPVLITVMFLNPFPMSQLRCLKLLNPWKKKGHEIPNFTRTLPAHGKEAIASTKVSDDRFNPRYGHTTYAVPKM
jgi:hypothetical protein